MNKCFRKDIIMNNEFDFNYEDVLPSVELADKAISFAETQLCNASLSCDNPEVYNVLLNSSIHKLSLLDPSPDSVFRVASRELKYITKLVRQFPVTIITLYSAILLTNEKRVLLKGTDCVLEIDTPSVEVEEKLSAGEQKVVLGVNKRAIYFLDLLATMSNAVSFPGWESDESFYTQVSNAMNQSRLFCGKNAEKFIKATTSPEKINFYKNSGALLDASQIAAMLVVAVLRRFGCDLSYDRSVNNFSLSQSAYNSYALLLDSYLRNILYNAQIICNAVLFTM